MAISDPCGIVMACGRPKYHRGHCGGFSRVDPEAQPASAVRRERSAMAHAVRLLGQGSSKAAMDHLGAALARQERP